MSKEKKNETEISVVEKLRAPLEWDDDPYAGTGIMMGVYATTSCRHGDYQILSWHGERMVPEWSHKDGAQQGTPVKYTLGGSVTLIIDGKEEKLANMRTREEAIAIAKQWCEEHAASISA